MFSGLGLGSGLYDDGKSIKGLNLDDYKVEPEVKRPVGLKLDIVNIMEPDTTAEKVPERTLMTPSDVDSDSDSDSDSSSSSDSSSDDTTSESEESSEESSDDEVPSFTRGFGRFDASSMPMVTQIRPTTAPSTPITATVSTSRFQSQQSMIKPPGLLTNFLKPAHYQPSIVQPSPVTPLPFFPIPFKIYSLRDATNCQILFPAAAQPIQPVPIPTNEKVDKDKRPAEKRERDRKRSRSHSRERDKKRLKDDRRKSPPRRRSPSPVKKRQSNADDRGRQIEERKDPRRSDPSTRHAPQSSRTSHGSR
jgi:hypothetical protein